MTTDVSRARLIETASGLGKAGGTAAVKIGRKTTTLRGCGQLAHPEDDSGDCHDGGVVSRGLFITGRDAAELLELGKAALDQMALLVERLVEGKLEGARGVIRDDGPRTLVGDRLAQAVAVVSSVGHDDVGRQLLDQGFGLRGIAPLAGREREPDRAAQTAYGQMDLGA